MRKGELSAFKKSLGKRRCLFSVIPERLNNDGSVWERGGTDRLAHFVEAMSQEKEGGAGGKRKGKMGCFLERTGVIGGKGKRRRRKKEMGGRSRKGKQKHIKSRREGDEGSPTTFKGN